MGVTLPRATDTRENNPAYLPTSLPTSPPSDSDKEGSDDIAEWQMSAAEFNNIDEDITAESYIELNHWIDDHFQSVPFPASDFGAITTATGFIEPENSASGFRPWRQQPIQQFGTSRLVAPPPKPQDASLGPSQALPRDIVESSMADQAAPRQGRNQGDWTMIGQRPNSLQQLRQPPADELQIISVNPLQPPLQSRPQRRRPYEDRERQEDASRTRGLKACVRCRMQKIKVRPRTPVSLGLVPTDH
jgi:hypothetical protein